MRSLTELAIGRMLPLVLFCCLPSPESHAQGVERNRPAFRAAALPIGAEELLSDTGVQRIRAVTLDNAVFDRTIAKSALANPGHRLPVAPVDMNLFPNQTMTVRWERVDQTDDFKSHVWTGSVEGYPRGEALFVVSANSVTGNVNRGDGIIYELRPAPGGGHWILEVDQRQLPRELTPPPEPPPLASHARKAEPRDVAAADDGSTIDVMVVYTPAVTAKAGGSQAAQQLVQLGIAETNRGYQNSGITQRVRLVYSGEVQYTETQALDTNLARLKATDDGYLDGVHALRETYSADLVSLWVEGGDACGIGYLLSDPSKPRPDLGFSVVARGCATGYYSFGHEMGHNMGAMHGRDDGTGPGAYPYSYGFKHIAGSASFRTVMAYDDNCSCTRILYWSNPGVQYNGTAVGIDPQSSESADNGLTLNNTRNVIANYRTATPSSGGSSDFPESDHPYVDNLDRTWTYTLAGNPVSINVTFDPRTSVEAGYDFIYLYDGDGNPVPGTPFTGGSLGGRTVTVTGSTIKIRLVSDESSVDFGFKISSITGNTGSGGQAPKLVITSFTVPATAAIGSMLSGTRVTIANQGTAAAGSFRIGYYYSRSRNVTTSDVSSGWSCSVTDGLAAGATYSCSGDIGVPSSLTPGNWYVAAIADDQNQVQQTDRSGNVRVADNPVSITGGTPAELLAPAPGSVLASATVVFQWTAGTGVSKYTLSIGTTASGTDIYNKDQGTSLSVTISNLPTNGSTLYVTLSSQIGSDTRSNNYTLKAATIGSGSSLARLVITSFTAPASGTVGTALADTSLVIKNQGSGSTGPFQIGYYFSRNSTVAVTDVDSGWSCSFAEGIPPGGTGTCSGSVGVPTTLTSGTWYLAAIADDQNKVPQSDRSGNVRVSDNGPLTITGRAPASITSPAPGSNLTASTVTFRWDTGSGAQGYTLLVGTSAGTGDIYTQDRGQNLSATVSGLPSNGRMLFVRLISSFGDDSLHNDYIYRAVNAATGGAAPILAITAFSAPTSGTIGANLTGSNLTVVNRGNSNAPPFRVAFYFGQSSRVTVNDVYSGWFCNVRSGLTAGSTFTCSGEIGVPASLTAGTWYLAAIADDQNLVQQADSSASTRVNDNGPVTLAGAAGGSGGPLPESDHPYSNNTDRSWTYVAEGNPSSIRVTFDLKTSLEQDYDFVYIYDGSGTQVSGSPFTGMDLAARAIVLRGSAVRIRLVSDDSENDYGFKVLAIEDAGRLPRLAVTSFTAPTRGVAGHTLPNTSMTVSNLGDAFAGPFEVGYYYSKNSIPTIRDVDSRYFCSVEDGLRPGATLTCTGEIGIPSSLSPGTWYIAAIADDLLMVDQPDRSGATKVSENGPVTITAADRDATASAAASGITAASLNQRRTR